MFSSKAEVRRIAVHQGAFPAFPSEHLLFSVRGSAGKLRMALCSSDQKNEPYCDTLLLDNKPLLQVYSSGCPTCESMLAAGSGLPGDSRAVREAAQRLNRPYAGLEDALDRLLPIIQLLQPGFYVLSYSEYCPTDGSGNFFWNIPENPAFYAATAQLFDHDEHDFFRVLPVFPCFLYPSQPADKFDPECVARYRGLIRAGETLPPVLAYSIWGYLSVLLDGHHRSSACALEGVGVPCLTISQSCCYWSNGVPYVTWPDESVTDATGLLSPELEKLFGHSNTNRDGPAQTVRDNIRFRRTWPEEYAAAARLYPSCWEAGTLALYPEEKLDAQGLHLLAMDEDCGGVSLAVRLLRYAARQPGADKKKLSMAFTEPGYPDELRRAAFEILDQIKDDPEIDDLMVQVLVDCEQTDPVYQIANRHWDSPIA